MTQVAPIEANTAPTPDLRETLLKMSSEERNLFLLQSPADINKQYPGFLDGRFLHENYDEATWGLQTEEHMSNVLFAGCEKFETLQEFAKQRIQVLMRQLTNNDSFNFRDGNIGHCLSIVQKFMEDQYRKTCEPSVAHIYRTTLRMVELIELFNSNSLTARLKAPFADALSAEFLICSAAMHDFLEDTFESDGQIISGSIVQRSDEGIRFGILEGSEIDSASNEINFGSDTLNDAFVLTLEALDSSKSPNELMAHIATGSEDLYQLFDQAENGNMMFLMAAYLVKCCDRLDNNATYFKSAIKLVEKCLENLRLFQGVLTVFKMCAGDENLSRAQIAACGRRYLHYLPDRVAKLLLAGFSPQEIYNRHEDGRGIPRSM